MKFVKFLPIKVLHKSNVNRDIIDRLCLTPLRIKIYTTFVRYLSLSYFPQNELLNYMKVHRRGDVF